MDAASGVPAAAPAIGGDGRPGVAGPRFVLRHRTTYDFDRLVALAPHEVRLRPAPHAQVPVAAYAFAVAPASRTLHWQQDPYANWVARLTFPERARRLAIDVELTATYIDVNPFDFFVDPSAFAWPFDYAAEVARALAPYRALPADDGPRLAAWVAAFRASVGSGEETVAMLVRLNRALRADVDYRVRDEPGVQAAETTLAMGHGSCRDSAWLLLTILRHLGFGARYVSGYLVELAHGDEGLDATRDRGSLHAWVEAFVPGAGWMGLDPTSGLFAAGGHVPLACAAEPDMAAPVSGTTDICETTFAASIELARVDPGPAASA
ncbi:MAG TPA: transglutaminase family protein [Casimicrobiaceae bacterium]|jgi:transglutaminase-like putative cysteine protease|nr:transglutaminase family protein [Casimicrobiaceae bacterium]